MYINKNYIKNKKNIIAYFQNGVILWSQTLLSNNFDKEKYLGNRLSENFWLV